ncbi:hypothetical protein [Streptomyces sp. NPDC059593]|uniref:hypothetical protein n=1 Tax=Streptomyces sp. NPDC059593 TaxID=3346878 RepID=UPI00369713E0
MRLRHAGLTAVLLTSALIPLAPAAQAAGTGQNDTVLTEGVGTRGCVPGKYFEATNPRVRQWSPEGNKFYNYNGTGQSMSQTVTSRTQTVATTSFTREIGIEVEFAFSYVSSKFIYGQGYTWTRSTWIGQDIATTVTIPPYSGLHSEYGTWGKDFDAKSWQRTCVGNTPYDTNVRTARLWVPINSTGWHVYQ